MLFSSARPPPHTMTMPLAKGSRIPNRTPNKRRTRRDSSLSDNLQHQLIIDLEEAHPEAKPSEIAATRRLYGEVSSKRRIAVCKRITRLRKVKQDTPEDYWEIYLEALRAQQNGILNQYSSSSEGSESESESVPSPTLPSNLKSAPGKQSAQKKLASKKNLTTPAKPLANPSVAKQVQAKSKRAKIRTNSNTMEVVRTCKSWFRSVYRFLSNLTTCFSPRES